jgi:hypothetical protein
VFQTTATSVVELRTSFIWHAAVEPFFGTEQIPVNFRGLDTNWCIRSGSETV